MQRAAAETKLLLDEATMGYGEAVSKGLPKPRHPPTTFWHKWRRGEQRDYLVITEFEGCNHCFRRFLTSKQCSTQAAALVLPPPRSPLLTGSRGLSDLNNDMGDAVRRATMDAAASAEHTAQLAQEERAAATMEVTGSVIALALTIQVSGSKRGQLPVPSYGSRKHCNLAACNQ